MINLNETITNFTGLDPNSFIAAFIEGSFLILCVTLTYLFFHKFLFNFIKRMIFKTNIKFVKRMIENGSIKKILWILTLNFLYLFSNTFKNDTYNQIYDKIIFFAIIIFSIRLTFNIIDMIIDKFEREATDGRTDQYFPIRPLFQIIKLFMFLIAVILIIAHFINQSPVYILSGLTAISAVFMFVFKDVIQGFMASFLVSLHKTVKVGDWIEVPKFLVNGIVSEITLNLINVKNFDNTMTVIPAQALLTESFKNWSIMFEEGRRIRRAIFIDASSIRILSPEDVERFKKIKLLKNYLVSKQVEIEDFNSDIKNDEFYSINARNLTNLGTFRKYIEYYLRSSKEVKQDLSLVVRLLDDEARGIPVEITCFTHKTARYQFEGVQSDIFEHIFSVMHIFGLKLFQEMSSGDIVNIIEQVPESKDPK